MFGTTKEEKQVEAKASALIKQYGFSAPRNLAERMRQQRILLDQLDAEPLDPVDRLTALARAYARAFPHPTC